MIFLSGTCICGEEDSEVVDKGTPGYYRAGMAGILQAEKAGYPLDMEGFRTTDIGNMTATTRTLLCIALASEGNALISCLRLKANVPRPG
jgi:hypothetical protein